MGAAAHASAPPACPPSPVHNGPPAAPGGNVTFMLDPLTNTIVDAPVASTPVNEAPAANVTFGTTVAPPDEPMPLVLDVGHLERTRFSPPHDPFASSNPVTNMIVDAPVASPPVNEAPAADFAVSTHPVPGAPTPWTHGVEVEAFMAQMLGVPTETLGTFLEQFPEPAAAVDKQEADEQERPAFDKNGTPDGSAAGGGWY
jgi:hypothetical protein